MKFKRIFTKEGQSPYAGVEFEKRKSEIRSVDGSTSSSMDVVVPKFWSQVATDIIAQKYFRKTGVPQKDESGKVIHDNNGNAILGTETDARQVFDRLAGCWTSWGHAHGYFDTEEDAKAFEEKFPFSFWRIVFIHSVFNDPFELVAYLTAAIPAMSTGAKYVIAFFIGVF